MDSILTSVKKLLGVAEEYEHFDSDITIYINSVLSILSQIGVGPKTGFVVYDSSATWTDYLKGNPSLELVKSYVFLKVKLLFDTPQSSALIESVNNQLKELECRIQMAVELDNSVE